MEEQTIERPNSSLVLFIFACLGLCAAGYAVVLNTEEGKQLAQDQTWLTVVLGNSLILFFLRILLPRYYWNLIAMSFIVAGTPMIARSIVNKS
ncbi:MAG: hypothetical protein IT328_05890 [Caldilineaceae bacterium]|nr:hypothetical protein [Caldilineaceae bacterium]